MLPYLDADWLSNASLHPSHRGLSLLPHLSLVLCSLHELVLLLIGHGLLLDVIPPLTLKLGSDDEGTKLQSTQEA